MIDLRVRAHSTSYQSSARNAVEPENGPSTSQQHEGATPSETPREHRPSTQKSLLVAALVKIANFYNELTVFLWRVGELHMLKIVNLTLICVVLYQVRFRFIFLFTSLWLQYIVCYLVSIKSSEHQSCSQYFIWVRYSLDKLATAVFSRFTPTNGQSKMDPHFGALVWLHSLICQTYFDLIIIVYFHGLFLPGVRDKRSYHHPAWHIHAVSSSSKSFILLLSNLELTRDSE